MTAINKMGIIFNCQRKLKLINRFNSSALQPTSLQLLNFVSRVNLTEGTKRINDSMVKDKI